MKWRKLGRVFDPDVHGLPEWSVGFAQSPQALPMDDRVRVYFSTRSRDRDKYLSRVAYVDLSEGLDRVLGVSTHEVIPLGGLGNFDEHGIFPMHVTRIDGEIRAYPSGWNRRVSVSVDTAIGLAISHDGGETFVRVGPGPVLGPSLHEPFLVGDGFVLRHEGVWHMWYIFGTDWRVMEPGHAPDRTYKIGHARSDDGLTWRTEQGTAIIADELGPDEAQALPTVVRVGDAWHMFFCFRESFGFRTDPSRGYRIGHAVSADLDTWTRDDDGPALEGTEGEWDSDMQCYPNAFSWRGETYLLYNGNEFGRYGFGLAVLER